MLATIPVSAGEDLHLCPKIVMHDNNGNEPIISACYWVNPTTVVMGLELLPEATTNMRTNLVGIFQPDVVSNNGTYILSQFYASSNGSFGVTITSEGNVFLADEIWGKYYYFEQNETAEGGWTRKEGVIDSITKIYAGDEIELRTEHGWLCPSLADEEKNIFSAASCFYADENNVFVNTIGSEGQFYGTWFDLRGADVQYMTASDVSSPPVVIPAEGKFVIATSEFQTVLHLSETTGRLTPSG
ncbi:MAG: hypothetical protein ABIS11_03050 [Candidatus Dojkabacteria bacterium]